jgi:hypothetical protein
LNIKFALVKMAECIICAEKFNKSNRNCIKCQYCDFEACKKCNETYLLNETIPKCMNNQCGREWTHNFLAQHFTRVFLNTTYKKHREQILVDKERALMPATQIFVERRNQLKHVIQEHEDICRQIAILTRRRQDVSNNMWQLRHGLNREDRTEQAREFVRACPDGNCKGFLSTQWKCGVCEKWTCNSCHEIKGLTRDAEHTCDPNNVSTATLLAQDTRACPKCHTPIHKIDGCDQMWCVMCHTGFSWRTGRIETSIHNPHYYEWLRRQNQGRDIPRNPGDNACGRDLSNQFMMLFYIRGATGRQVTNLSNIYARTMKLTVYQNMYLDVGNIMPPEFVRLNRHIRQVDAAAYHNQIDGYEIRNRDLRISYMMNEINEDKYRIMLQQREKKHNKIQELYNVLVMLTNTVDDILGRLATSLETFRRSRSIPNTRSNWAEESDTLVLIDEEILAPLCELDPLVKYVNECLVDVAHTYGSVTYHITRQFHFEPLTGDA